MKETKIYCDHCGAVLDEMVDYTDCEIDTIKSFVKCDLCKECVELLDETIKKFLNKEDK